MDERSFEALFRGSYAALCSFAHGYVHSREDAEEIVQSVFLKVWSKRDQLEAATSIRAYLFASVRNEALNRSARARLEQRWYEQAATDDLDPNPTADAALQSSEVTARVRAAIDALPPGAKRVLTLRWEQQLSYAEIAEALGISIKGVENQLSRARQLLRNQLQDLIT